MPAIPQGCVRVRARVLSGLVYLHVSASIKKAPHPYLISLLVSVEGQHGKVLKGVQELEQVCAGRGNDTLRAHTFITHTTAIPAMSYWIFRESGLSCFSLASNIRQRPFIAESCVIFFGSFFLVAQQRMSSALHSYQRLEVTEGPVRPGLSRRRCPFVHHNRVCHFFL